MGTRESTICLAATLVAGPGAVWASGPPSAIDVATDAAAREIEEGDFAGVIERLEPLAESSDNPAVRFYLAAALLGEGRRDEASRMLVKFYSSFGRTKTPERFRHLVGASAALADRIYGWESVAQPDEKPGDDVRGVLWGGLIASGVAAVGLGVATAVGAVQASEHGAALDDFEDVDGKRVYADPDAAALALRGEATFETGAIGAAISAAAALGFGIALALTADDEAEAEVSVTPEIGPDGAPAGAHLSLGLRF